MPSIMQRVGTPNPRHNIDNEYRKFLDNVDPKLSKHNAVLQRKSVAERKHRSYPDAFSFIKRTDAC